MKTDVFEILKRATVFMILAQAVIHFRPSPVYEKYIRFLTGIMTAVILFLPMMEVFRGGMREDYWDSLAECREQVEKVSLKNLSVQDISDSTYIRTVEEKIRDMINVSLTDESIKASRVELIGLDDGKEGNVQKAGIRIYMRENAGGNKITVGTISIDREQEDGIGSENMRLREKISGILQTDSDKVEVVILDGTS